VRWVDLLGDRPRLEVELAKAGTTPADLVKDIQDVPELSEICEKLDGEGQLRLALEEFGDKRRPQPTERTLYPHPWVIDDFANPANSAPTPDRCQLPPLDDDKAPTPKERSTKPGPGRAEISKTAFYNAMSLFDGGVALAEIERQTGLSWRQVGYIRDARNHAPGYTIEPGTVPGNVILRLH
jgi:hypothetical protein